MVKLDPLDLQEKQVQKAYQAMASLDRQVRCSIIGI
jgi:hypothetical protein